MFDQLVQRYTRVKYVAGQPVYAIMEVSIAMSLFPVAPTVVYETATNVDTSRVDDTASKCVLMDARYDSDCTNVTAEFGKHLPASVQWETILYNRENGNCADSLVDYKWTL